MLVLIYTLIIKKSFEKLNFFLLKKKVTTGFFSFFSLNCSSISIKTKPSRLNYVASIHIFEPLYKE